MNCNLYNCDVVIYQLNLSKPTSKTKLRLYLMVSSVIVAELSHLQDFSLIFQSLLSLFKLRKLISPRILWELTSILKLFEANSFQTYISSQISRYHQRRQWPSLGILSYSSLYFLIV